MSLLSNLLAPLTSIIPKQVADLAAQATTALPGGELVSQFAQQAVNGAYGTDGQSPFDY